jgi:hypothetical protein
MKTFLTTTVAALALMGAVADANAFGISISFGGLRFHHVGRHHYGSARHHHRSEPRSASRSKSAKRTREANTAGPKDGKLAFAVTGSKATADKVWDRYTSLQEKFKQFVGPVVFFTYANVVDFRAKTGIVEARDATWGMSKQYEKDGHKLCAVYLMESAGEVQFANITLVHELAHCIDFNFNVGHRMSVMEAYFADVAATGKDKIKEDGFSYFLSEPQEAYAQSVAYLTGIPTTLSPVWEADFPRLMAELRRMFDVEHIAYNPAKLDCVKYECDDVAFKQDKFPTSASAVGGSVTAPVPVAPLDY